jgi:hypothetical protein
VKRDKSRSETDFGISGSLWGLGQATERLGSRRFSALQRAIILFRIMKLAVGESLKANYR